VLPLERIHIQSEEGYSDASVCSLDTDYLLVYFKKLLTDDKYNILLQIIKDKESLLFDICKYPEDLHQECIKRNRDLEPLIALCNEADDTQALKKTFLIKYLEWGGLLCYENKCSINFKDLDAKTFMIKGANGTGKSAIYDILQLAIWATNNKFDTYSAGFINHNKKNGYTIVDIEVGDITYRIKREFSKKKASFKITTKSSVLYKFSELQADAPELQVLKKDSACNMEVKALFGDINTFLSTSMITQSIDNDILGLNYKDTLATLDKSHNIQFIYNLFNLFKTTINKYKDFRKVIQSKKEVYEKLLFNGKKNDVNDDVISQLAEKLYASNIEKEMLLKEYEAINVDINDPSCLAICDTDYTVLINGILETSESSTSVASAIVTEEVYEKYKEDVRHYRYLYSIIDDDDKENKERLRDMRKSAKLYSQQLEEDFKALPCINKPCESSYLYDEEKALGDYIAIDSAGTEDIIGYLVNQKEDLVIQKAALCDLVSNKPNKISTENQYPSRNRDVATLTSISKKIFGDTDKLKEFISATTKPPVINLKMLKQLRVSISDCHPITIDHYTSICDTKEVLEEDMRDIKNRIVSLEKDFNNLFSKQQQLTTVNIPSNAINTGSAGSAGSAGSTDNKMLNKAEAIAKEMQRYDIVMDSIDTKIADDELLMNQYHQKIQEITKLDDDIANYKKELDVLSTNEEYKYNPECCICCNRPWVSRIKEIGIIINALYIARENVNYSSADYEIVKARLEENTNTKATYNLLNDWLYYYKYKEAYDNITNDLNIIIKTKNDLQGRLTNNAEELHKINIYIEYFIHKSFMLFEELNNIHLNDTYKVWESRYNETKAYIEDLEKRIHYNENIKPRIAKYRELKKAYDDWEQYERNKKVVDSYHYYKLKKAIEINDLYNGYQNNARMKPLIKRKMELRTLIEATTMDAKQMNDRMVEYSTINAYNNENKRNYDALFAIDSNIANIIDVLDTILINFQSFRKELYDNLILNKLVEKANKIIKTLCHTNTKPFKLNYNAEISNDTVHINWLIHNVNISSECDKQYISVSQASGFQRFAISLALRMSLYFNNYDILCGQLFIDEGFINFDKNNLSIVPTFLKSLLQYFNTIVILSHIDVIQDSVDETAEICFNNISGVSSIVYK